MSTPNRKKTHREVPLLKSRHPGHVAGHSSRSLVALDMPVTPRQKRLGISTFGAPETADILRSLFALIFTLGNTSSTAQGGGGSFEKRKPIGEVRCCESKWWEAAQWR